MKTPNKDHAWFIVTPTAGLLPFTGATTEVGAWRAWTNVVGEVSPDVRASHKAVHAVITWGSR